MGHKVRHRPARFPRRRATDIVEYVKILRMSRGGDLGMMIGDGGLAAT